jgi:hypothetical protein
MKMRYTRAQLEELAANKPLEARCTAGWATATLATLELEGRTDEFDYRGTAHLRLEPGGWKLKNDGWTRTERK